MSLAIICFTKFGYNKMNELADKLSDIEIIKNCKGSSFLNESVSIDLTSWALENFKSGNDLLFIGASGIAVRAIAPIIDNKLSDRAVIVMDDEARYVIPLLSGHVGGANELAIKIAACMDAEAVITTSTDIHNKFAIDIFAKKNHLYIKNKDGIAKVSAKVLRGEKSVIVYSDEWNSPDKVSLLYKDAEFIKRADYHGDSADVWIGCTEPDITTSLWLMPRDIVLGIGCKKNTEFSKLKDFIEALIKENNIDEKRIRVIASIDIKKDEKCLNKLASDKKWEFITFSAERLNSISGKFTQSAYVRQITGTDNVCERAAAACADGKYEFILRKTAENGMTAAIVRLF